MQRDWEEAVLQGVVDELQLLYAQGADIDARNGKGQTALMLAAAEGQAPVVKWLVKHGADLDLTAKYSLSALMLAVIRGHPDVVKFLIESGADLSVRGTGAPGFWGKTAFDLAVDQGASEVIELLRSAAAGKHV